MLPKPKVPLSNSCSTLYNNTLYSYTPDAFQSLELTAGAVWKTLPMGVAVTGSVCVQATPVDNSTPAALYIVGGVANGTQSSYEGFQRYIFSDARWETLTPSAPVTENRLYHSAAYLNASASILMYAGNQDGTMQPSSQTFTISTTPPYMVFAFESIAPPAVQPILLQWSHSQAVMIGGSSSNRKIMTFNPTTSWTDSGCSLVQPLKNSTAVKAVIMNGDDGSKSLYTFDMTVSPNIVNRTLLIDGNGNAVPVAGPVKRSLDDQLLSDAPDQELVGIIKRANLTAAQWPVYNSSLAPTGTRNGYSIAQDSSGLVVMSGGNQDYVLCMFEARDNHWLNASALLSSKLTTASSTVSSIIAISTSSIMSATSTSAPAATTSPSFVSTSSDTPSGINMTLLGAVIGSVVGAAVLILCGFLFFRWRRNRRRYIEAGHQRRASGIPPEEKDPAIFDDGQLPFDHPRDLGRGHQYHESHGSFSSVAILMGRVGQAPTSGRLGRRNGSNGSDSSSAFNKNYKSAISKPIPQPRPDILENIGTVEKDILPAPPTIGSGEKPRGSWTGRRGSTRRSSGWNRYWSGGSALNVFGLGTKRATYGSNSDRSSQYSDAGVPARAIQEMTPVQSSQNFDRPTGRMNHVLTASPTIAHTPKDFPAQSMAAQIERPNSANSVSSYGDTQRDAFSSGVPSSVNEHDAWTPVGGQKWGAGGPIPHNTYTESDYASSQAQSSILGNPSHNNPMGRFPKPPSHQPQQHSSDMSWLNLGANSQG